MTTLTRTVTVSTPVPVVAAYLSDFTTSADWDPHTASCRRLDDGPLTVGSRFENVQRLAGHDTAVTLTVVEYEPGRRIVLDGGNDTAHSRDEMEFSATADGGTQITYTVTLELTGAAKLAQPLVRPALARVSDEGARSMHERLAALDPTGRT